MRLAATVASEDEAEAFRGFLDSHEIAEEDRVIRRIALRGFASEGVALARVDLMPEITITAEGVYWHPVGAEPQGRRWRGLRGFRLGGSCRASEASAGWSKQA